MKWGYLKLVVNPSATTFNTSCVSPIPLPPLKPSRSLFRQDAGQFGEQLAGVADFDPLGPLFFQYRVFRQCLFQLLPLTIQKASRPAYINVGQDVVLEHRQGFFEGFQVKNRPPHVIGAGDVHEDVVAATSYGKDG